jgi:hypothetical protein
MKAEHIRDWLAAARRKENPFTDSWLVIVATVQYMFQTGEVPQRMCWSTLALLPKPDGGGVRGIGLLEVAWKLTEAIIDSRVKRKGKLHDCIHGFTSMRGCGTATVEAKLQQELASILKVPLYMIFLDLKKAYDTLDRPRALQILKEYGIGPRLLKVLKSFWNQQRIVARQAGYYGAAFTATRGQTQGGLFGPMLFNIVEDHVLHYWLTEVLDADGNPRHDGFGLTAAEFMAIFYADDGLTSSTDHVWLQDAFDKLIDLFRRVGLQTNVAKTKSMTCYPGFSLHLLGCPTRPTTAESLARALPSGNSASPRSNAQNVASR